MKKTLTRLFIIILFSLVVNLPLWRQLPAEAGANHTLYLPTIPQKHDPTTPLFGVQMYGNSGPTRDYHPYLVGSQASWLRIAVSWDSIEPTNTTPDNFNWVSIDRIMSAAIPANGGLNIIATIEKNPSWAATDINGVIDNEDLDEFAELMGALVERYDGDGVDDASGSPKVENWEIYNEPDRATAPARWGNDGDKYAQMLAVIYPVMKDASPYAQVVFGGIAFDWFLEDGGPFNQEFLDDVLAAGGGPYIDVMNFHSYPTFAVNWNGVVDSTGVIAKTAAVRSIMATHNLDVPIVITEAGHHSNAAVGVPSTEELQARYLVTLFTESMVADIDAMIWWMLYDIGAFYPFDNGLVTNSDNPIQEKVAYAVFQDVVQTLGTDRFVRTLSSAEVGSTEASVHLFEDFVNEKMTYVAWRTVVPSDEMITIQIPVSSATVRDSVTNATVTLKDNDDGLADNKITLQINGRPVYVEVDQ